ncbi:hypothetical protein BaRGS_00026204 [Batillaria attramentaria]|uniref:ABC1 atypical kinase-like domain-containing protein n=1 Tax=Batillaria attramentaria TaxID=370345 RepID=A0ABD0K6W0_9CAEN
MARVLFVMNMSQRCFTVQRSCRKTFNKQTFQMFASHQATRKLIKHAMIVGASAVGTCLSLTVVRGFTTSSVLAHSAASVLEPEDCAAAVIKSKPTPAEKDEVVSFGRRVIQKFVLFLRFSQIGLTFGPLLMLYPLTLISSKLYALWLKGLFRAVENAGPVFIKLGQWASTRRDLFSKEFCDQFSALHHHVRPHAWKHTEKALNAAYGKPSKWMKVLKIDKTQAPVGTGCVAQVYKAYVHTSILDRDIIDALEETDVDDLYYKDGQIENGMRDYSDNPDYIPVAIKVLHPNIRVQFARDLALMKVMARVLETVIPSLRWVNVTECVAEFSVAMVKQMDMIHEAKCLERFHDDFSHVTSIRIPVPIKSLVSRDVLVESFEDGQPISDFLSESEDIPKGLRHKLADIGVNALLQMVFVKNFVHGDLHPGNILVQNANSFQEEPETNLVMVDVGDTMVTMVAPVESPVRLVLLDCGITATLNDSDKTKFRQVFTAVVKGEGEVVADLFLEKSAHVECSDPEAFRKEMAAIVSVARETALQLSKIKVSALLSDVFSVLSRHKVKLESNFATIILAIAILEGLGRSLDPELDILKKASGVLLG